MADVLGVHLQVVEDVLARGEDEGALSDGQVGEAHQGPRDVGEQLVVHRSGKHRGPVFLLVPISVFVFGRQGSLRTSVRRGRLWDGNLGRSRSVVPNAANLGALLKYVDGVKDLLGHEILCCGQATWKVLIGGHGEAGIRDREMAA